jgi:hypothetical protein
VYVSRTGAGVGLGLGVPAEGEGVRLCGRGCGVAFAACGAPARSSSIFSNGPAGTAIPPPKAGGPAGDAAGVGRGETAGVGEGF